MGIRGTLVSKSTSKSSVKLSDARRELKALRDERERLREALANVVGVAENLIRGLECDHDVGMCACGDRRTIAVAKAALTPAAGGTRHGDTVRGVS